MLPGLPYVLHMTGYESLNNNEKEKPVFVFSFRRKDFLLLYITSHKCGVVMWGILFDIFV